MTTGGTERDATTVPEVEPTLPTPVSRAHTTPVPHPLLEALGEGYLRRYRPGLPIARGGIGQVLSAEDLALAREVAVKELLDPGNAHTQVRFEREARLTARLEHPGIVAVHEFGRRPSGELYLVMRKVRGEPLSTALARARTAAERLALLPALTAVAEAVGYAHQEGVVHRDLKPSNILLGAHGETVVVDWGLAKDLQAPGELEPGPSTPPAPLTASGEGLTLAGSLLGTPEYMSPEQARGESADARSDVYALGAVLYHALSGRLPYDGPTAMAVLVKVVQGPPPALTPTDTGLSPELLAIIARAMQRDPAARYADAAALAKDLRRYQTGSLVEAHAYSPGALVVRWARRHAALLAMALGAALLLTGLGVYSVRRIVAEREEATRQARQAERMAQFLGSILSAADPRESEGHDVTARTLLDRAAASIETELVSEPLLLARMQLTLAAAYVSLGLDAQARDLAEKGLALRVHAFGEDDPRTFEAELEVLDTISEPASAEAAARKVVERLRSPRFDADEQRRALSRALGSLGNALTMQDRNVEAEVPLRESVALRQQAGANFDVGLSLVALATALSQEGRHDEAAALTEQALKLFQREVAADSPFILKAEQNLGVNAFFAGRPTDAARSQENLLPRMERVMGPEHPATFQLRGNLAASYLALGRLEEARSLLETTLARARAAPAGPVVELLYNLACVEARQGQSTQALTHLEEAFTRGLPAPVRHHLGEDSDLQSLHGQPRFDALLEKAAHDAP
jgi:tetratricopeptide (TPR) repeat protein